MTRMPPDPSTGLATDKWRLSRAGGGRTLTGADVLRLFDQLRRQVALVRHSSEGVFLGYDALDLALADGVEWLKLQGTARLIGTIERLDTIEYVANVVDRRAKHTCQVATASGVTAIVTAANEKYI